MLKDGKRAAEFQTPFMFLIVTKHGQMLATSFDRTEADSRAEGIDGLVLAVPIVSDFRPTVPDGDQS